MKLTRKTLGYAKRAAQALAQRKHRDAGRHREALQEVINLTVRVIEQTERRVLRGESVPAGEKVVSIFEPHTDVIRKDGRETLYGHKICLSVGASNLITDCVILDGNPADSTLTTKMMRRHTDLFGQAPEQAAFDGAFGSKENLRELEDIGIRDVAFTKAKWASVSDMVKDSWTYRRLRDFRAGVEGVISFLKRAFGLSRCRRRGERAFQAHVRSSVVAANLLILARHALR